MSYYDVCVQVNNPPSVVDHPFGHRNDAQHYLAECREAGYTAVLVEPERPAVDDVHDKLMSTLRSLGYDLDPVADRLLYEALIEASRPF